MWKATLCLVSIGAAAGVGCGNGSGGPGSDDPQTDFPGGDTSAPGEGSPWPSLAGPVIDVGGGVALSSGGHGSDGGAVRIDSAGPLVVDSALPPRSGPDVPSPPSDGDTVTADQLSADVVADGNIRVIGDIDVTGKGATRSITSKAGDIIVAGRLRTAHLDSGRQGIDLEAPAGTIFITGSVIAGGGASGGESGGAIHLAAKRVVIVNGRLISAGGASPNGRGGDGGDIDIVASGGEVLLSRGGIDTSGGRGDTRGGNAGAISIDAGSIFLHGGVDASGGQGTMRGGDGAAIELLAGGETWLWGRTRIRGGAATGDGDVSGGDAGSLTIDATGLTRVEGIVDGRGGLAGAASADAAAAAGDAGTVAIGDHQRPASVEIVAALGLRGGSGPEIAGAGGVLDLQARGGDLTLAGVIDVSGGDSVNSPGPAGAATGFSGPDAGGIYVDGKLIGRGGSALPGGDADGGLGADIFLRALSLKGDFVVAPDGRVVADGGDGSGTGHAGGGGGLAFWLTDGNASMGGELYVRGGGNPDPGGSGGDGGTMQLWTDTDANGIGGTLTVEKTGLIDASGGPGAQGGSGRNNGGQGTANFPDHLEQIAILLNSETIPGPPVDGWLVNKGRVVSVGGATDGWGGDIIYHGRRPDGTEDPLPGKVINHGDGNGEDGGFAAE